MTIMFRVSARVTCGVQYLFLAIDTSMAWISTCASSPYFVAVSEHRPFGRAAEQLYITQTVLSRQVRVFKRDLECTLLVRTTRSMELTAARKQLYEEAQGILAVEASDETVPAQRRRHTPVFVPKPNRTGSSRPPPQPPGLLQNSAGHSPALDVLSRRRRRRRARHVVPE
ncbi:LysR family transcriptional regulator [Streptomyces sp. NPDC047049]|uniref:LysR family transcriptional regulator n=1 Tax=Streptomyces sp. NPDC047049 TaxID=3156688 RepID=UPI0034026D45